MPQLIQEYKIGNGILQVYIEFQVNEKQKALLKFLIF